MVASRVQENEGGNVLTLEQANLSIEGACSAVQWFGMSFSFNIYNMIHVRGVGVRYPVHSLVHGSVL